MEPNCRMCGYDTSPGGGCHCNDVEAPRPLPLFQEWHSGDVGRPVMTPADDERLRALPDDAVVQYASGIEWEMSGLAIFHREPTTLSAKALKASFGLL